MTFQGLDTLQLTHDKNKSLVDRCFKKHFLECIRRIINYANHLLLFWQILIEMLFPSVCLFIHFSLKGHGFLRGYLHQFH